MIIKAAGNFVPAPEGLHKAVCVDVVDLGELETPWGYKPKLKLVWEIEAEMPDGGRYTVSKRYTASLHEKSTLHKDLKSWRNRPFTADELAGFDMEKVVGAPCQVMVVHEEKDGTVYANVIAITRNQGRPLEPSGHYVRVKDRPADNGMPARRQERWPQPAPIEEESIPF